MNLTNKIIDFSRKLTAVTGLYSRCMFDKYIYHRLIETENDL